MLTDFCDNINELDEHLADKLELFNERFTDLLPVSKRFKRFADYLHLKVWAFIFFVSIACALNGCAINYLGTTLMKGTKKFKFVPKNPKARFALNGLVTNPVMNCLVSILLSIFFALVATWLCAKFSPEAEGSGIPELKTYLSGLRVSGYVSFRYQFILSKGKILSCEIHWTYFDGRFKFRNRQRRPLHPTVRNDLEFFQPRALVQRSTQKIVLQKSDFNCSGRRWGDVHLWG
jgi:hypothetical protein